MWVDDEHQLNLSVEHQGSDLLQRRVLWNRDYRAHSILHRWAVALQTRDGFMLDEHHIKV